MTAEASEETATEPQPKQARSGLGYWMRRVLTECDTVGAEMSVDAVHDLRVALRRCRSMADVMLELDPNPAWREMRKAGKRLFQRMGEVRDAQVMAGWVRNLAPADDPVRVRMQALLAAREQECTLRAQRSLERFPRKQWRARAGTLGKRARRVRVDGPVFQLLALDRWTAAYELHRRALRSRSQVSYHRLRIALKRLRYTVENFLPRLHEQWGKDLKKAQDLLGEVHDLDVLGGELRQTGTLFDAAARARWRAWINQARETRLAKYREQMTGKESRWAVWRAGLPQGKPLEAAAMAKLAAYAVYLDPEIAHARRVARLALRLSSGLRKAGVGAGVRDLRGQRILRAAALLHDVGLAEGRKGHHKGSYRMIRALPPPAGWTVAEMELAALVARYHRGASPREGHAAYAALPYDQRESVAMLAGVLRLADALDRHSDSTRRHVKVQNSPEAIVVWAEGYREDEESTAFVAKKKFLLEATCKRPVIIQRWQAGEGAGGNKPAQRGENTPTRRAATEV